MKNIRTMKIMEYLKEKKYCSMTELQAKFGVSCATIHRDVAGLVSRGMLQKIHGGVTCQEAHPEYGSKGFSPFRERIEWNRGRKQMISQQALREIGEGDILFLDSSTTVYFLAKMLADSSFSNLTIITNSVQIIQEFRFFPPHYVLIGLGGAYDIQLNAFLGQAALRELESLSISKAFLSAFGITDEKVTTNHEQHAGLLTKVLQIARSRYLLADRSKFDREGLFKFASPRLFDKVISEP